MLFTSNRGLKKKKRKKKIIFRNVILTVTNLDIYQSLFSLSLSPFSLIHSYIAFDNPGYKQFLNPPVLE